MSATPRIQPLPDLRRRPHSAVPHDQLHPRTLPRLPKKRCEGRALNRRQVNLATHDARRLIVVKMSLMQAGGKEFIHAPHTKRHEESTRTFVSLSCYFVCLRG